MTLKLLVFFAIISFCVCPFIFYIYRRDKKRGYIIEGSKIISREDDPSNFQSRMNVYLYRFMLIMISSLIANLLLGILLYKEIKLEQEWIDSIR